MPTPNRASPAIPPSDATEAEFAHAFRVVTGSYRTALGTKNVVLQGGGGDAADTIRQHTFLRSVWADREAATMVAQLNESFSRHAENDAADPISRHTQPGAAQPTPRRRVLLVDDSSDILVTVGTFLDASGFAVTVACNADTALQLLATSRTDLLVTDHAMPGMTGKQLVTQACQQHKGLRALIITGYPNLKELGTLPSGVTLLAKPFRRAELLARIGLLFGPDATSAKNSCAARI